MTDEINVNSLTKKIEQTNDKIKQLGRVISIKERMLENCQVFLSAGGINLRLSGSETLKRIESELNSIADKLKAEIDEEKAFLEMLSKLSEDKTFILMLSKLSKE